MRIATSTLPNNNLATTSTATSTVTKTASSTVISLTCTMSYTSDLYDTPSGHLDPGYTIAPDVTTATTSPAQGPVAHKLGTQSWTACKDPNGASYEFKLEPQEYLDMTKPGGKIPGRTMTAQL